MYAIRSYYEAVAQLRRQVASVRRFLAPQREALDRLVRQAGTWIRDEDLQNLHDESDRITRYVEDLDLVRERTMVLQEETARIASWADSYNFV